MKKILFVFAFLCATIAANAKTEKGTWLINTSATGLDLSFGGGKSNEFGSRNHFGFTGEGGYMIMDNLAILGTLGGDWSKPVDFYSIGAKARYYFDNIGLFAGGGVLVRNVQPNIGDDSTDFAFVLEAGYSFFLSKTIAIEPALYYNISVKDSDWSRFGLKVGFSFYF